jgi:hypothetical protein
MPLTLDEIVEHEERLRLEIVERECLLAAFKVLHGYAANGQSPKSMELSSLASALVSPSAPPAPLTEVTAEPVPAAAPATLPAPAPYKPYVNPELIALGAQRRSDGLMVKWAIQRMTDDYTLRDIVALLEREGLNMPAAQISVVLTRLKSRGEIEEIKRGGGRRPAVFRKPESAPPPETNSTEQTGSAEPTTELVSAAE